MMMIFLKALVISKSTPIKMAYKPTLRITIIWMTLTSISPKICTEARMVLLACQWISMPVSTMSIPIRLKEIQYRALSSITSIINS